MKDRPLVSVRLMTYNHEAFIEKAIKGVLDQVVTFNVELIIGDDFSSDRTAEVIKESIINTNKKISIRFLDRPLNGRYYKQRKEKGRKYNFINIIKNCNGKYIALLDGDDYWTDHQKLQKQVDFMEKNENYMLCFHNVSLLYSSGRKVPFLGNEWDCSLNSDKIRLKLVEQNILASCSVLYRNINIDYSKFLSLPFVDYPLYIILSNKGKIAYLDANMGVYRKHEAGIWTGINSIEKFLQLIYFRTSFLKKNLLSSEEKNINNKEIKRLCKSISKLYIKELKIFDLVYFWMKFFKNELS